MSIDKRLERLLPGLSAKERALLMLRDFKADKPQDRQLLRTAPDDQGDALNRLIGLIDGTIKSVATSQGARVADVYSAFNPSGAAEIPTLCLLTAICTSLHDTHPTDAGYAVMALKLWQVSGYTRRDG